MEKIYVSRMGFCVFTLVVGLLTSSCCARPPEQASSEQVFSAKESALFYAHVTDKVRREYVEPVENGKLLEGALNGMLSSLDPHSAYLTPKKFQDIQKQAHGEYGGIGLEVTAQEGLLKVVSPIDDTPAQKAGLQGEDVILSINGESLVGLTIYEMSEKLRGQPGSRLTLSIRRGTLPPFDVKMTRERIKVIPVKWRIEDTMGYIRITTFNEHTTQTLRKAIAEIQDKLDSKLLGFVVDVRNNPGGLLDEGISVTDLFLAQGEIVSIRGRDPKKNLSFKAQGKDITGGLPLVVLINGGSASASEIFAGALQDHRRAVIVGTKSFGKGSVQTVIPMTNGGAIKLTTARYYTPSGRTIQKSGIEPDIKVAQHVDLKSVNEEKRLREGDLKSAIPAQAESIESSTVSDKIKAASSKIGLLKDVEDFQLQQAFTILKTLTLQKMAATKELKDL